MPLPSPAALNSFAAQLSPRVSESFGVRAATPPRDAHAPCPRARRLPRPPQVTPNAMLDFLLTEDMLREDVLSQISQTGIGQGISPLPLESPGGPSVKGGAPWPAPE